MLKLSEFPSNAKVWCYVAPKSFTQAEVEYIETSAETFVSKWLSHGNQVVGGIEIKYNQFVVIYADECGDTMCGRAVDSSVRFVKEIEEVLGLLLMDRMQIAYRENDEIKTIHINELSKLSANTIVFNNMVTSKAEFDKNWELPLGESAFARVLG